MRNNNASIARQSSASVSAVPSEITTRMSPITVKQTPTIAEETVKMWIEISCSRRWF